MKRLLALLALGAFSCGLFAQAVDTTVCEVLKNPQAFNGKIVRIKGTVTAGFDQFAIKGAGCGHYVNDIWLSYPEGTKAKAGPWAVLQLQPASNFSGKIDAAVRTPVVLEKSKDFKLFDSLLSTPKKGNGMCLGCMRYDVTATLVGRLDGVSDAGIQRDAAGKIVGLGGFGNFNGYGARLVLQSVSDITPQEIDYSKIDAITKSEAMPEMPSSNDAFDAIGVGYKGVTALGATTPAGIQVERALASFPKQNDKGAGGVLIISGSTNEAGAKYEAQDSRTSPDGVTYNCMFNMGRLQGLALTFAIVHMGNHVADVRKPAAGAEKATPWEQEYAAWASTALTVIVSGQKTLTLPGGYMLFNTAWPNADRPKLIDENLASFLSTEELLSR